MLRREFLARSLAAAGCGRVRFAGAAPPGRRPDLAGILVGYNIRWHADKQRS